VLNLGYEEPPDMLYAAARHGPAYGSTIAEIDDARARTMPGVRLIMPVPTDVDASEAKSESERPEQATRSGTSRAHANKTRQRSLSRAL
jgi:hypothetical protein